MILGEPQRLLESNHLQELDIQYRSKLAMHKTFPLFLEGGHKMGEKFGFFFFEDLKVFARYQDGQS